MDTKSQILDNRNMGRTGANPVRLMHCLRICVGDGALPWCEPAMRRLLVTEY